jgi:hypothetical protein
MPPLSNLRDRLFQHIERRRLRWHFARVAARIEATRQGAQRSATLESLRSYADLGMFPRHGGPGRSRPVFVDDRGVRCAMAFLIENTTEADLVERVRQSANHAYIDDLRSDGALLRALDELDLSTDEAAAIQPGYSAGPGACIVAFAFQWLAAVAGLLLVPLVARSVARRRVRPLWPYALLSLLILAGAISYSGTRPVPVEEFGFGPMDAGLTLCGTAFTPRSVLAQIRRFSEP